MPLYDYECTKCDHVFEEEAPITAPARQRCPRCRGKVKRLISGGSGILFKGSGFYVTDSRRPSGPADGGGKKDDAAAPAKASADAKSTSAANDSTKGSSDKT